MNMQFHTQHITLSDKQKDYITKTIQHMSVMDRHIDDPASTIHIDVKHLAVKNKDESIEIDVHMTVPHGNFKVADCGKTPEEAVDKVVLKLRKQIEKYKGKNLPSHDLTKEEMLQEMGEFDYLLEEIE